MCKVGIFYGSSSGNTKKIAELIEREIKKYFITHVYDVSICKICDWKLYDIWIIGTSTWYYGELQYDWKNFLYSYRKLSFLGKYVAFFGCGNQIIYSNYFCNALYILHKIALIKKANIIGYWPNIGYKFNYSKILLDKKTFLGLVLDEDNQSLLSPKRVYIWIKKLYKELRKYIL